MINLCSKQQHSKPENQQLNENYMDLKITSSFISMETFIVKTCFKILITEFYWLNAAKKNYNIKKNKPKRIPLTFDFKLINKLWCIKNYLSLYVGGLTSLLIYFFHSKLLLEIKWCNVKINKYISSIEPQQ